MTQVNSMYLQQLFVCWWYLGVALGVDTVIGIG